MKQVKKDSKYIIKRILIGVGIAIILANLKKCNVYADDLSKLYINIFGYNNSISNNSAGNTVYDFNYSNYNININNNSGSSFYYILFKDSDNYYLLTSNTFNYSCSNFSSFDSINFNNSTIQLYNNNSLVCDLVSPGFLEVRILSNNNISNNVFYNELITNNYFSSFSNSNYNNDFNYSVLVQENNISDSNKFLGIYNTLSYMKENFELVSSSVPVYLDDSQLLPIPQGFTEIDITNYDGVYFVPKNYNNIQIETVDNINFMDFNFWFKGSIKYGYFPLEQPPNMVSDYQERVSINEFQYVDSVLPLYENTDMTGYQYYSYFIYNSQKGQDTKIYYNSTLFNYFLIEDMFTYVNENVCTIDRNNENMCFKVDFQSYLDNYWLEGFAEGGDEFSDDGFAGGRHKIDAYLDLLKIPFNFLRSLNRDSCSPIDLPIPYVGGNIQLNCLSDVFKRTLGTFYYILFYIVSAFYIYFITIKNIDTFTDILNPNDDKLEVVDL